MERRQGLRDVVRHIDVANRGIASNCPSRRDIWIQRVVANVWGPSRTHSLTHSMPRTPRIQYNPEAISLKDIYLEARTGKMYVSPFRDKQGIEWSVYLIEWLDQ